MPELPRAARQAPVVSRVGDPGTGNDWLFYVRVLRMGEVLRGLSGSLGHSVSSYRSYP